MSAFVSCSELKGAELLKMLSNMFKSIHVPIQLELHYSETSSKTMFSKPIFPSLNPVGIANSHYQYNVEGGYVLRLLWGFSHEKRSKKPGQYLQNKD